MRDTESNSVHIVKEVLIWLEKPLYNLESSACYFRPDRNVFNQNLKSAYSFCLFQNIVLIHFFSPIYS